MWMVNFRKNRGSTLILLRGHFVQQFFLLDSKIKKHGNKK